MLIILLLMLTITFNFLIVKKYNKNAKLCKNIDNFNNLFKNSTHKYKYINLSFSNTHYSFKTIFKYKIKPFFFMKDIVKNKDYYLTLSKFVDYKINYNKNKFRSKKGFVLIESVADVIFNDFKFKGKTNIFFNYKSFCNTFKLRQKEKRVIKLILAKKLLVNLAELLLQLNSLSAIITKSASINHVKSYKDNSYLLAEFYGIMKFNPNSTYLRDVISRKYNLNIQSFFDMLNCYKNKLNRTTHYLKIMFS